MLRGWWKARQYKICFRFWILTSSMRTIYVCCVCSEFNKWHGIPHVSDSRRSTLCCALCTSHLNMSSISNATRSFFPSHQRTIKWKWINEKKTNQNFLFLNLCLYLFFCSDCLFSLFHLLYRLPLSTWRSACVGHLKTSKTNLMRRTLSYERFANAT